jgi:hypothetical protein
MSVSFMVELNQDRLIAESELPFATAAERAQLANKEAFQGDLVLAGDEQTEVRISDLLEAWVQNLCFDAVPKILAGESVEILYFSYEGRVRLEPHGPKVRVSGDHVPSAEFAARDLTPALVACGDRFLAWAREAKSSDASYQANLDYIEGFRQAAAAAVEASTTPSTTLGPC